MITITLRDFIQQSLSFLTTPGTTEKFEAFLTDSRIKPDDLARYATFSSDHYHRNCCYLDDEVGILLLCWDIGQASVIHDHADQRCWARIEAGYMQIQHYQHTDAQQIKATSTAITASAGMLEIPNGIHKMANLAEFNQRAISLHVYAKPFTSCNAFDVETGTSKLVTPQIDHDYRAELSI